MRKVDDGAGRVRPRSDRWLAALVVVIVLTLLLAFQLVVRGAVERGEIRRRANAVLLDATWRCRIIHTSALRQACMRQLADLSHDNAGESP